MSWIQKSWGSFSDVAPGIPPRRQNLSDRRADFAGASRPLALEQRADRGGSGLAGESPGVLEKHRQKSRRFGSYTLQAAIAAVHAEAESVAATDWRQIVALYDQLVRIQPSPVVELDRAVAMHSRWSRGRSRDLEAALQHGELANYYLAHSARADMYRRLGRTAEARSSYEKALALTQQEPERQFLQERIRQLK